MVDQELYDLIIIGGGPGGLAAAQYGARAKLKTIVIDKNPMAGALGKASRIENYPGILLPIPGPELLGNMRKQAEDFGAQFQRGQVVGANLSKDPKEVMTNEGLFQGKCVIIATGAMGRKPTIAGEADFLGKGVSYCATCDAPFFRDKDVAAVGELAVMIDELSAVAKFARKIYVVTREKELTPEQEQVIKENPKLELMLSHNITEITGEFTVKSIKVSDASGSQRELEVSGVFMYLQGAQPIVEFLLGALELNPNGCIKVDRDMSTSIPGVYAIGDVTCKQIRQVVVATAEGSIAALSADKYINERKRTRAQWGTQ